MKTFKVEVIWPNKTYETEVKCHRVEWSDAGNYVFVLENEVGGNEIVAMQPVGRTIVTKIKDTNVTIVK